MPVVAKEERVKHLLIATLLLVSIVLVPVAAFGQPETSITAYASGAQQVPRIVATKTKATLKLSFRRTMVSAGYELEVARGKDIVAAHLHCGVAGENGPVVVALFGGAATDVDGVLATGVLRARDIFPHDAATCGVPIVNIASLLAAIRAEVIYLNVHSVLNPGGEVRAQVLHLH